MEGDLWWKTTFKIFQPSFLPYTTVVEILKTNNAYVLSHPIFQSILSSLWGAKTDPSKYKDCFYYIDFTLALWWVFPKCLLGYNLQLESVRTCSYLPAYGYVDRDIILNFYWNNKKRYLKGMNEWNDKRG